MDDSAAGYDRHAHAFLRARDQSWIGAALVERWARSLRPGAEVLEIGCGGGYPITRVLRNAGLNVWALDASPTLVREFEVRFPAIPVECAPALGSTFFDRQFDAVIAIGLMFLLAEEDQSTLIHRMAAVLRDSGQLLFTSPLQPCEWVDMITGETSRSLGRQRYEKLLADAGLRIVAIDTDEGGNNYYRAQRGAA